jgi:hypothetical protein
VSHRLIAHGRGSQRRNSRCAAENRGIDARGRRFYRTHTQSAEKITEEIEILYTTQPFRPFDIWAPVKPLVVSIRGYLPSITPDANIPAAFLCHNEKEPVHFFLHELPFFSIASLLRSQVTTVRLAAKINLEKEGKIMREKKKRSEGNTTNTDRLLGTTARVVAPCVAFKIRRRVCH